MSEPRILHFSEPELRDPVAIIGLPTIGLVGSILAGLMIREMKLPVVSGVTSPDFPPYTFIMDGVPCPQIRILAGTPVRPRKKKKKSAEETVTDAPKEMEAPRKRTKPRDLVIVTSEIAPKPEQTYDVTMAVLEELGRLGVTDIVFLDGVGGPDANMPIIGVAGNDYGRDLLESAGLEIMKDGLVRGMSGTLLMEGIQSGFNVMGLLVPANSQFPDPRASARLAEPIMKMYPRFVVDTETLFKEAEDIDNRIQAQQSQQNLQDSGFYG